MMDKELKADKRSYAAPLFLSGAVIGAIAGILLAPDSGKETRRKLSVWLKEKSRKGKEEFEPGKETCRKDGQKHAVAP